MTNETLETIKKRRSCRAYKPEQITDEELNAVLEAGTYAASAMGRQSAKIVVVQDAATRAQLTRMNAAVMGTNNDPMYAAPTILVVLADANSKNAVQDGSRHDFLQDVTVKEQRTLVLAARETPLSGIHLRNLYELSMLPGVRIIPPMLTFYHKPESIDDMVYHIAAKLLEPFGIEAKEYRRWNGL